MKTCRLFSSFLMKIILANKKNCISDRTLIISQDFLAIKGKFCDDLIRISLFTYAFLKSLTTVGAGVNIMAGVSSPPLNFRLGIIIIVFLF